MEELENSSSLFNTSPKSSAIDPPKKSLFDTSAKKAISSTTGLSGQTHGYNLGIGDSKYDEGLTYATDIDENNIQETLNEYRAQNQSNLAKTGSGLGRILTKATTEILKMPVVLGGIAMAPFAEEGEGFETAFNNSWIKALNNLNETVNTELLPVYVKKAVSEGNLWDNISSIDFWATEGADGIGFIASMLAPGAFLKSLNLGNKILGATSKGIALANGESKLAGATRLLTEMGVTAEGIDLTATTLANTFFEAGSEAGSAMDNFDKGREDYISRRSLERFADLDAERRSGNITDEQYNNLSALVPEEVNKEFDQQKGLLGRDIFLSNVAILLGPNAIQSKMIWGKAGARQLIDQAEPSLLNKVINRSKNVGAAVASEGFFEEGGQSTVENMFTNSANKGQLTNNFAKNFSVGELLSNYADTVTTTEGQKAIFLGGVLGGGMYAYQGAKSDKADRNRSNNLLNLVEGTVSNFNTVYETDPYMRNEDGSIQLSRRNNQPIYDPVKVNKIAKALALTEEQNLAFEEAVTKGDEETVQKFKDQAINQLIIPFINQGEMGIDALRQYLDQSRKGTDIEAQGDPKAYEELTKSIIDKASYLQTQYESYRDFSRDLVQLDQLPEATKDDYTEFYNNLADFYLNYKADEFTQRQRLQDLNKSKADVINELQSNQSLLEDNTQFVEGVTEDLYRNKKIESDPRIKKLNTQIETTKQNLRDIDETVNDFVWNKEEVNKAFKERVRINNKLREDNSPENIAKTDEAVNAINSATTPEEVDAIASDNPIVNQQAQAKKDEIEDTNMIAEQRERDLAIESELKGELLPPEVAESLSSLDFGQTIQPTMVQDTAQNKVPEAHQELIVTEGSEFTDELIPKYKDNNSLEELTAINNGNVDNGKGVKVISTDRFSGEPFDFILEQFPGYIEFEREPVNKEGRQVGFEINQNPGKVSSEVKKALVAFNKGDFSNEQLIYDYLPINVQFTDQIKAPIETKRKTGTTDMYTQLLRIEVISRLLQGQSISNIKGSIQGQYKGMLQIDSIQPGVAENNISNLDAVKGDINYIRNNLYVVNSQGQLQNIINNNTLSFTNPFTKDSTRTKENARGEIYLMIPQANGQPFPLKLNIKRVNELEANIIYDIYKEILNSEKSLNTTLIEVSDELRNNLVDNFTPELNIIGGNIQDITLGSIIDLMIYESSNPKSQIRIEGDLLLLGEQSFTAEDIELAKDSIIDFLVNNKRHQIKIGPKSETDNTKTNLKSNSADYLKYLIDNKILNTNAVVNQPTFQGYTNIYLNPSVSLQEDVKPISNIKDKLSKIRTLDGLTEAYNTLTTEQQGIYKQLFTDRKTELNNGINIDTVKTSEQGVEIKADNFTLLDFNKTEQVEEEIPMILVEDNKKDISRKDLDLLKINESEDNILFIPRYILRSNVNDGRLSEQKLLENLGKNSPSAAINLLNRLNDYYKNNNNSFNNLDLEIDNFLNNIRNSENNFVSLSEIPGTVENTEITKVQEEVYEVPNDPKERKQDIDRLISLHKRIQSGRELRANELSDYNKFKNTYPQEFEKRCK